MTDLSITLKNNKVINGTHPIVIIGANGSGKTTYANQLAKNQNSEWIGATRNLQFSDNIPMQTHEAAIRDVNHLKNTQRNQPWALSNELSQLLTKLKAEDSESAVKYRDSSFISLGVKPELTKIVKLRNIWNSIFPQREIDLSTYSPKVKAHHRNNIPEFGISRMSGGERVALYLLARILDASPGLIFVDEPEIHFHSILAKKFWNELEKLRNDCRFIYVTHDVTFATSRKNVQFVIVHSDTEQILLEQHNQIPETVIDQVLGAATFSVCTKNIVFHEGSKGNKRDDDLYAAWFYNENIATIPVGSCDEVMKCVDVINENKTIQGAKAIGIVDRDFHPDEYIESLKDTVHVLPFHEVESLFCLKDVFFAVGKQLRKSIEELERMYAVFVEKAYDHFKNESIDKKKLILERVKQKTEWKNKSLLNGLSNPNKDIATLKSDYVNALKVENWSISPENHFDSEIEMVEQILSENNIEKFLRIFQGKILLGIVVQPLGINPNTYVDIVISILKDSDSEINRNIRSKLQPHFPDFPVN
jgi:ABC-type cobalamin/Fe3+-siderophores transport system ATPase subunit